MNNNICMKWEKVEIPLHFNLKISSFIFWSKIQTDRQEYYLSVLWIIGLDPDTEHISGNKKMLLLKEKCLIQSYWLDCSKAQVKLSGP